MDLSDDDDMIEQQALMIKMSIFHLISIKVPKRTWDIA
jgi:hypothetical protein